MLKKMKNKKESNNRMRKIHKKFQKIRKLNSLKNKCWKNTNLKQSQSNKHKNSKFSINQSIR